jgi:hypothetical protein
VTTKKKTVLKHLLQLQRHSAEPIRGRQEEVRAEGELVVEEAETRARAKLGGSQEIAIAELEAASFRRKIKVFKTVDVGVVILESF